MKITAAARPFIMSFPNGYAVSLSSEEAQRLIDGYPVVRANANRVVLKRDCASIETTIQPATLGGGAAFLIEK